MVITIVFLISFILFFIFRYYLKEFIEMTVIFKSLKKVLESRDLLVLKFLPDVKNKEIVEEILNLINERKIQSKISYNNAIQADNKLHNKLKELYDEINKMNKNEIQEELFKTIIEHEKRLKELRIRYSSAVEMYNLSLTIHPKLLIKVLHLKPLDVYAKKE